MKSTDKKIKIYRAVGLIALTIAVIGVVVLSMYITQKSENSKPKDVFFNIGETYEGEDWDIGLQTMKMYKGQGNEIAVFVNISLTAKKDSVFLLSDFKIDSKDICKDKYDDIALQNQIQLATQDVTLKSGQSQNIWLCFAIEQSLKSSVLTYKHVNFKLGSIAVL